MEGIKYVNLIEIGPVVIEIRGVENGMAFLAADTQPCVLILNEFLVI